MDPEPAPVRRRGLNAAGGAGVWAGLITAGTIVLWLFAPQDAPVATVVWAILIGVIALGYAAAVMLRHLPLQQVPRRELELPRLRRYRPERDAAPGLREMERMVIFGQASGYDFETRLRPCLVRIAEQRLAASGLTLQSAPERVKARLGPDAWELVRPDYQPVGDRRRFGVPWARLVRAVEGLDAV